MTRYAFLVSPSHNRVYAADAPRLAAAELAVLGARALEGRVSGVRQETIGGVPYVVFEVDGDLDDADVRAVSNLASLYALFEVDGSAGSADVSLRPVGLRPRDRFGSDLITIQKYAGKTNEDFTKLLLGVTVLGTDNPAALGDPDARLHVLDPLCGRGTTLNQALQYGWQASGVDVDVKDVEAYATFLRTWLKSSRLKHHAELATVRRDGKVLGRRLDAQVGATREEYKAGRTIDVSVVAADTLRAGDFFKAGTFDVVVTDAPYGVQHGTRSRGTGTGPRGRDVLDRSPLALLEKAVPVWTRLLRRGGAMGISWNVRVAPRAELVRVLTGAGLEVLGGGASGGDAASVDGWPGFEHRVDQAIVRDLVVARRP